jgi:antitoxin MazE
MRVTLKKWGNSAAVRIPAPVLQAASLELDETVEVREEKGRIIIERVKKKSYRIDDLLKGIKASNLHGSVDFGSPEGKENW